MSSARKLLGVAIVALLTTSLGAVAQSPIRTVPMGVVSTNASGTIAVTNTFQSVFPSRAPSTTTPTQPGRGRASCTLQNNGTNSMYVYFGAIAGATLAKSVKLAAGQAVNCTVMGVVLLDQVAITGTSTEAYYAAEQ